MAQSRFFQTPATQASEVCPSQSHRSGSELVHIVELRRLALDCCDRWYAMPAQRAAGMSESASSGGSDAGAAPVVLVGGGDVTDGGVQADGVVFVADHGELRPQDLRVTDPVKVWPVSFHVGEEALDPRLVGRVPGRPKCCAIAHIAINSRVDPEVICGPLSLTASSTAPRCSAVTSTVG